MYFTHLFENLPKLDLTNKEELRKYLPYSQELPSYIRTLSKSEIKAILNEAKSQVWSSKDGFIIYSSAVYLYHLQIWRLQIIEKMDPDN